MEQLLRLYVCLRMEWCNAMNYTTYACQHCLRRVSRGTIDHLIRKKRKKQNKRNYFQH